MRFPRHAKIFRGQIDPASVAGMFFLLLLFMLLLGTHVFIPGVRVRLQETPEAPELTSRLLKVLSSGQVFYAGRTYAVEEFEKKIRDQDKAGTLPRRLIFDHEPGASEKVIERLRLLGAELKVGLRAPGNRIELPEFAGFEGTTNPVVVVDINVNGQVFFQHQVVRDEVLQDKLSLLARNHKLPLTMMVQADRDTRLDKFIKVCAIARKAGIAEVSIATLPAPFDQ